MLVDLDAFRSASVRNDPFDHAIVTGFIRSDALDRVHADYPDVGRPGSYPVGSVACGPAFAKVLDEIRSPGMTHIVEEKFGIDLSNRPTMVTVRDRCRARDGQVHIDSKDKLVTVLIYMNPPWEADGGRLRLLRGPGDIDDYAAEVPPDAGTMLVFRCTPDAWHGHRPFEGRRRAIQLNWVTDDRYVRREQRRHRVSAFFKRLKGK